MKKLCMLCLVVITVLMMGLNVCAAPSRGDYRIAVAYVADVTVDGAIDDVWQYAPKYSAWNPPSGKVEGVDYPLFTVQTLWNGSDKVYFLLYVEETEVAGNETWWLALQEANDGSPSAVRAKLDVTGKQTWGNWGEGNGTYVVTRNENVLICEGEFNITEGTTGYIAAELAFNYGPAGLRFAATNDFTALFDTAGQIELNTTKALPEQPGGDNNGDGEGEAPDTADFSLAVAFVAISAVAGVLFTKKRHH